MKTLSETLVIDKYHQLLKGKELNPNRKQDHRFRYQMLHHSRQVNKPVVAKITQNPSMSQKENQEDHQTNHQKRKNQNINEIQSPNQKQQMLNKKPSQKAKQNQLHMVLRKTRINHGARTRNGKPRILSIPQLRQILFEIDPSINQR